MHAIDPLRRNGPLRPLFTGLGLLLLYALPTLIYLRPIWADWGGRIAGRSGDPVFNLYVLKWGVHQLRLGLPDLWDANIFYPVRGALAFSDHLLGPALQLRLLLDLGLVPNPIAGYDLLLLSSFVLSGAATCWVLRQSGRSWLAAALGGGMYAFAPMRWAHLEHLQILLAQWVPLTLWYWHRLLAEVSWRRAAAFVPFYLLHLAGGSYLAYMIHLPMLALLVNRGTAGWRRLASWRSLRVLLAVALPAAAAVYLLYAPYVETSRRYGLVRLPVEIAHYAATLPSYLAPSEINLYAGGWQRIAGPLHLELSYDESRLFAGFLATAGFVYGVLVFLRRSHARPVRPLARWQQAVLASLLALAGLSFLAGDLCTLRSEAWEGAWNAPALGCALGLGLWLLLRRLWGGNWPLDGAAMEPWERGMALAGSLCFLFSFPIAFVPLTHLIPGLSSLRAPGRFHVFTSLAIVTFAAQGLDAWLPAARGRRAALGAALAVALALEVAPAAVAWRPLRDEADFPAVDPYLRSAGEVRALLVLPRLRPARESLYMYESTLHRKPIANGYSGFIPASDRELRERIPLLPDEPGFALLRQRGITHLLLHLGRADGRALRRALPDWERQHLGREVELAFAADADRLYKLLDPGQNKSPALP